LYVAGEVHGGATEHRSVVVFSVVPAGQFGDWMQADRALL
jgi:hypothetical protein